MSVPVWPGRLAGHRVLQAHLHCSVARNAPALCGWWVSYGWTWFCRPRAVAWATPAFLRPRAWRAGTYLSVRLLGSRPGPPGAWIESWRSVVPTHSWLERVGGQAGFKGRGHWRPQEEQPIPATLGRVLQTCWHNPAEAWLCPPRPLECSGRHRCRGPGSLGRAPWAQPEPRPAVPSLERTAVALRPALLMAAPRIT